MSRARPRNIGEYHFDCPLDNTLFGFKGVKGADFKAQIENGASDQEMVDGSIATAKKKRRTKSKRWGDIVTATTRTTIPKSGNGSLTN